MPLVLTNDDPAWDRLDEDTKAYLQQIANNCLWLIAKGDLAGAVAEMKSHSLSNEEKIAMWFRLDSKQRSAMKRQMKGA